MSIERDRVGGIGSLRPMSDWANVALLLEGATFPAALWSGSEMRFRWMNRAFLEVLEDVRPQFDLLGLPMRGFLSDTRSATRFIDAAYTGQALTVPEYEYRTSWGETTYWQLSYLPLPGRITDPYDVLMTAIDITTTVRARKEAERHRDDLLAAVRIIDATVLSSLDADEILQRVLVEATEVFKADWGWLAEREGDTWVLRNVHGWPVEMIGLRFASDEQSMPALAARRRDVVRAVASTADDEERALLERHDVGALLMVPIMHRGDVDAVMGFCFDAEVPLHAVHAEIAQQIAVSVSLALENAHAYEMQLRLTRTLQSAFFSAPTELPGWEVGHLYHSAEAGALIGRDFFDVVPLEGERVGVVIGSVVTPSPQTAALTTLVKSAMRAELLREPSPSSVMATTGEIVIKGAPAEAVVTAFAGLLDARSGEVAYCSAGHPSPVVARRGGHCVFLELQQRALGSSKASRYAVDHVVIDEGDLLVAYTPGLVNATNGRGERFGTERVLETVASCADRKARDVPEELFMRAFSFAEGHLHDDVAIVALRRTGEGVDGSQGRLELPVAV